MSEIIVEFLKEKFINGFQEAEQELKQNFPLYSDFLEIKGILEPISVSKLEEANAKSWLYNLNDTLAACITFGEQHRGPIKANPLSLTEHNFVTKMQKPLKAIKQSLKSIPIIGDATSLSAQASDSPPISSSSTALAVDNLEKVLYGAYEIYGFDPQLKTIRESLLKNRSIGIVGMGGSGKSALAQVLLKTVITEKHFQIGFWLSLSDLKKNDYNKWIFKSVRMDPEGILWVDKHDNLSIKEVETKLFEPLPTDNQPSIMVIDGANHESEWCKSLLSAMKEFGRKIGIVVTSRVLDVAVEMVGGEKNVHQIQLLKKESCWSIFEDTVNENGLVDVAHPTIVRMKDEIMERCYGLPLAAKTLAEIIPNQIYALDE